MHLSAALLALVLAACALWLSQQARLTLKQMQSVTKTVGDYATQQTQVLQSEKNQKAIEAGIAVAASVQGSVRLFNTQTLPRVNSELDALRGTTLALQSAIWETKAAMAVNSGHISEILVEAKGATEELRGAAQGLRLVAEQTGVTVPEIAGAFKALIQDGRATTAQVNALLADPNLPALVAQAERLLRESGDIAVNIDAAAAELPPIMRTARRWQTPLNVARLVGALVGLL